MCIEFDDIKTNCPKCEFGGICNESTSWKYKGCEACKGSGFITVEDLLNRIVELENNMEVLNQRTKGIKKVG